MSIRSLLYAPLLLSLSVVGCTFDSDEQFPSALMTTTRSLFAAVSDTTAADIDAQYLDRASPPLPEVPAALSDVATIDIEEVAGFSVWTLTPKADASALRLLYIHGGGWVNELDTGHLTTLAELITRTGVTVTVPLYGLAPEHTVEDATPFLDAVYQRLLDEGAADTIRVGGDSAGGNIALAQVMHWRDLGLPLPARVFLFAPAPDIAFADPAIAALDPFDGLDLDAVRQWGRYWTGDLDPRDPILSPLHGTFDDLPPLFITVGTAEMLFVDNQSLAAALGADVLLVKNATSVLPSPRRSRHAVLMYPGAFHVFHLARTLPEADDVMRRLVEFLVEETP